ncbi:agamous-like MADS-box protein AGL62 [Malus domestica]|uniref:agamous-like MADS-box protein AGL62 n=1 Tax=Malus domestica TaxID=3750 RepID=UPI0007EDA1FF|nr:agamous-like MADS-box protein AGL62 [Malus domestica]
MEAKKTRGRQKTEMKRIEKEDDRLVVFSKRRSGIYKKATENLFWRPTGRKKILQAIENYNESVEHLEVVKECRKALRQLEGQRGSGEQKVWWKPPIKDLDLQGLKQMHDSFKRVTDHVSSNLRLTQGSRFDNCTASTSASAVSNPNPNHSH